MRAGGGLGELRPEAAGASSTAEGAMAVESWFWLKLQGEPLFHDAQARRRKQVTSAQIVELCCMLVVVGVAPSTPEVLYLYRDIADQHL